MTTYTTWTVGDILNICASVEDFCGQQSTSIYLDEINVTKNPDPCTISHNTSGGCGLHIDNIEVTFKLAKALGTECSHGTPTIVYQPIGVATTDSYGVCGLQYQVTNQDRAHYESSGGNYKIFATISNAGGQLISTENKCTSNITILQNPCIGITCPPNDCTGFDLYTYTCNPTTGICDRTLLTPLSPACGYIVPSAETHYLYFKVPELYPVGYVISGISTIFQAASNAISGYTDYYVEAVDFDQVTYIVTVTITKTSILGIRGPNSGIQTMPIFLIPLAYWLAVLAGIIAGTLYFLILRYLGSKSVTGESVSTRTITVIPQICTGDATAGTTSCVNPTSPMIITVEYSLGKVNTIREITDGNPITFSAPTDVGITIIGKVKDNPYYTVIKKAIEKGITNETVTLKFIAKEDATITPGAVDATTHSPITGSYIIYEETVDGSLVEVQRGNLDSNGKVAPPFKAKAGVNTCTIIIPVDIDVHKTEMNCIKPLAGEILTPEIPIKTCSEAKNHISVRTVYISSADGGRYGYTADSIQIKVGTDIVNTVLPTTDITYIDGLDKDTNYTVHIIKPGYAMLNNDQSVSFSTDCDTTVALIVESNPPSGTRDITIEVRNVTANAAIQGANVTLDSMPIRKTDGTGTIAFMAIPDGDHDILLTLEGYKDGQSTITVSSTATSFTKTMIVDQVNATVDTRIDGFTNVGDAIATKPIKFEGYLQYLDTEAQPASYKPLTDATVTITVKDANNEILKTFTVVTGAGLLSVGYFETGEWLIVNEFADTGMTVEASFEGIGRYKPSSFSVDYAIAAADACVIPLPWGGCLLSKETGTSLLLLGALAVGGLVLMGSASKSITGKATERIVEIPAHYRPPQEIVSR
jgi:hypothetical protein